MNTMLISEQKLTMFTKSSVIVYTANRKWIKNYIEGKYCLSSFSNMKEFLKIGLQLPKLLVKTARMFFFAHSVHSCCIIDLMIVRFRSSLDRMIVDAFLRGSLRVNSFRFCLSLLMLYVFRLHSSPSMS